MKTITTIFLTTITLTLTAKPPKQFRLCNRKQSDFNKCLAQAAQETVTSLTKPIPELGLPNLNPLEIPSVAVQAGTSAVNLEQNFKNIKIYGITDLTCSQMNVDFEKKTMKSECFHPEMRMETQYDINGKILLLDIHGHGPGTINLKNVTIKVNYKLDEYQKNGQKYLNITKIDLDLTPQRVILKFENLFNGDQVLSDHVHKVVNENWSVVYDDVKSTYNEIFGRITLSFFNSILKKISINDLFGEE